MLVQDRRLLGVWSAGDVAIIVAGSAAAIALFIHLEAVSAWWAGPLEEYLAELLVSVCP